MASAAEIIHDVETMYEAYSNAFNAGDIDKVATYIAAPYAMIIGAFPNIVVSPTAEANNAMFHKNYADMKGRGWVRSDFKIVKVWPMSDNHAIIMTDITRYKANGAVLETGRYCYHLHRGEPTWKIAAVTDVAPPFTGPGDFPRTV